jgi:hypothetical protein
MERAAEPSDYIWENIGMQPLKAARNTILVFIALSLILSAAYYLQFRMQKTVFEYDKFEQLDCSIFERSINATESTVDFSNLDEDDKTKQWTAWFNDANDATKNHLPYTRVKY